MDFSNFIMFHKFMHTYPGFVVPTVKQTETHALPTWISGMFDFVLCIMTAEAFVTSISYYCC